MRNFRSDQMVDKVAAVAVVCYLLAVIHPFLFPAVTLSTGELKPRGVYFEENALLGGMRTCTV